jgi:immunity protein 5 of polymorphic toxin system
MIYMVETSKRPLDNIELTDLVTQMDNRQGRLFACDCAERVLPLFETVHLSECLMRQTIESGRLYAEGRTAWESVLAVSSSDWESLAPTSDMQAARAVTCSVGNTHPEKGGWQAALWGSMVAAAAVGLAAVSQGSGSFQDALAAEKQWQKQRAIWYLNGEQSELN